MKYEYYEVSLLGCKTSDPLGMSTLSKFDNLEDAKKCVDFWKRPNVGVIARISKVILDTLSDSKPSDN